VDHLLASLLEPGSLSILVGLRQAAADILSYSWLRSYRQLRSHSRFRLCPCTCAHDLPALQRRLGNVVSILWLDPRPASVEPLDRSVTGRYSSRPGAS
jgi:hypothetical protein